MAFTKFTEDLNIIQKLSNLPNETDGMSPESLKAAFDESGNITQDFINSMIDELESEGAEKIGIHNIEGVSGDNVQGALESLKSQINEAVTGNIPDDSLNGSVLHAGAITERELGGDSVTADKIKNLEVTDAKIVSVSANKITGELDGSILKEKSVDTLQLKDTAVDHNKLKTDAVWEINIKGNSVTASKILKGAVTKYFTATILGFDWAGSEAPYTFDVTVNGINEDDNPIVSLDTSNMNYDYYVEAKEAWSHVYRIKTSSNKITVYADEPFDFAVPIRLMCVRK